MTTLIAAVEAIYHLCSALQLSTTRKIKKRETKERGINRATIRSRLNPGDEVLTWRREKYHGKAWHYSMADILVKALRVHYLAPTVSLLVIESDSDKRGGKEAREPRRHQLDETPPLPRPPIVVVYFSFLTGPRKQLPLELQN